MKDINVEWKRLLSRDARGGILPTISNLAYILKYDEKLKGIVYNQLTESIDVIGDVPWMREKNGWNAADMANLDWYIDREYGIYAPARCKEALCAYLANEKRYHPIKEYLESCIWDGINRLDTLLIKYLGATDNEYVRTVTRKTMVAAVCRVYNRGEKFDSVLVLSGPQGIGKSTLFSKLGGKWYSDALTMSDMKDKTASEKMQGVWIMEIGELSGMKKVDVETVKAFISRTDDKYRHTYGQFVESHPRGAIIVGSTNSLNGFLRDVTGNRRFWPVVVTGNSQAKIWDISQDEIDMVWAEAKVLYERGENNYLPEKVELIAKDEQRKALEADPRQGMVEEYLKDKEIVCLMQIWCECLMKERQNVKKRDIYDLENIIQQIGGWNLYKGNASGKMRFEDYGVQRAYIRCKE